MLATGEHSCKWADQEDTPGVTPGLDSLKAFQMVNCKRLIIIFSFQKAFTLIELMIVITIISLLFGVVISSTGVLRSTANDVQIKSDLAQIQGALQSYYADQNYYPHSGTGGFKLNGSSPTTSLTNTVGMRSPAPSPLPSPKTYMSKIPTNNAATYCYVAVNNSINKQSCDNGTNRCNYYYLSAKLDDPGSSSAPPTEGQCSGVTVNYFLAP